MHLHPAGNALVVAGGEVNAVSRGRLRDALASAGVPDGRICHAVGELPPSEQRVLAFKAHHLRELLLRRPLNSLVGCRRAAVQLCDPVEIAVVVHGPVPNGERLGVAKVVAPAKRPSAWNIEWLDYVAPLVPLPQRLHAQAQLLCSLRRRVGNEILEELPLEYVPAAVQPRLAQLVRQVLQFGHVLRLFLHQSVVVRYQRLREGIVLRALAALVPALDEEALDVAVGYAAGVAGVISALWVLIAAGTHRQIDLADPVLLKVGGLIQEDHIVLRALILAEIGVAIAVAKPDGGTVVEFEHFLGGVVPRQPLKHPFERLYVVVGKLSVRPSDDQQPDARVPERKQPRLVSHCPALPAASGAAVGHMTVRVGKEKLLLWGRALPLHADAHLLHSSISGGSSTTMSLLPASVAALALSISSRSAAIRCASASACVGMP